MRLRLFAASYLEQAHFFRGEYEGAIELATANLAAMPADWVYESFGVAIPIAIYDRYRLIQSLAWLGRFAEAARYEAEALRLAEQTQQAYTLGMVQDAASWFHLIKGDWAKARSRTSTGSRWSGHATESSIYPAPWPPPPGRSRRSAR